MESVSLLRPTWRVRLRRTLFFGLTLATSAAATALLLDALEANGVTGIEVVGVVLFFGLFTWIAGALWTAIAGFGVLLAGRDPAGIAVPELAGRSLQTRTAIVMPIYNEDPVRVGAGLTAIWSSLGRESEEHAFDLFILSDTSDARIAENEEILWQGLSARVGPNTGV
jgi:membrane glycosyltransferase